MKIIDFHTHAFPDALAERAMSALQAGCPDAQAFLDGRLSSLLASMDAGGIETSVVCNIATKPAQFEPIFKWCQAIRSDRIEPFPSVHPADPDAPEKVRQVAQAGFKGLKVHPYYQDFDLDDAALSPFYEAVCDAGLWLTAHTGYDIAFERVEKASPRQIRNLLDRFSSLKFVATHFGGWEQWDQVEQLLIGRPVYMETSWSMEFLGPERVTQLFRSHPSEYLLFGTDSPWTDQAATAQSYKQLAVSSDRLKDFFYANACKLLGKGL